MPAPARGSRHPVLRPLLWTLLGAWIGAMMLFAFGFARVVFEVVPSPAVAGELVGRMLGPLELAGAAAGAGLAALGGALGRGVAAVGLPLLLSAACLVSHFGVTPAVAAIRLADPSAAPDAGARFARLHGLSMGLFTATLLGALALALVHALREAREKPSDDPASCS